MLRLASSCCMRTWGRVGMRAVYTAKLSFQTWKLQFILASHTRPRSHSTITLHTCPPCPPVQSVPLCFVGTVGCLEAIVTILCDEMALAFKQQGLPVPPWRSKTAMLSKWAPQQLLALAAKIAGVRRTSMPGDACSGGRGNGAQFAGVAGGAAPHAQLRCDERPAAQTMTHAAAGSAPACTQQHGPPVSGLVNGAGAVPHFYPGPSAAPMAVDGWELQGPPANGLGGAAAPAHPALHAAALPIAAPPDPQAAAVAAQTQAAQVAPAANVTLVTVAQAVAAACAGGASGALSGSTGFGSSNSLKFTRKASAEWKSRSNGKKVKSLLAAALKKSGSRGNLSSAAAAAAAAVVAGGGAGPCAEEGAAAGGGAGAGPGAVRRNTAAIRTVPNEAGWGCITTVRWGAFHEQQPPPPLPQAQQPQ